MSDNEEIIEGEFEEEKQSVALVKAADTFSIANLKTSRDQEEAIARLKGAIEFRQMAINLALSTAHQADIQDFNGKPHVGEHVCEKIFSMLGGGNIEVKSMIKEQEPDSWEYGYEATVIVSHPVFGSSEGVGFFHVEEMKDKYGKYTGKQSAYRHIVRQRARTRAVGFALRRMLGLSGLEWKDLRELGFDPDKATKVDYKKQQSKTQPKAKPNHSDAREKILDSLKGFVKDKGNDINFEKLGNWAFDLGYKGRILDCDDMNILNTLLTTCKTYCEDGGQQ